MSKIESYLTPDGRRAEMRVDVIAGLNGEEKVVQEIFEEEQLPKSLKKRITETKKPVVVEREIETIDNNDVVERRRESVQPDCKMELREVVKFKQVEKEPELLTKQDVEDAVKAALKNAPRSVSPYQTLAAENTGETAAKVNIWNALGVLVILAQVLAIGYFWLF